MKPTNVLDVKREGDLGGQRIGMRIDPNSAAHIMALLTDLYSDPELAVLREYSTNARDAHIMAGNPAPIEVTTPNGMSPYFKVKDYGLGLDAADIEEIYSQYGASTKRATNDAQGMLGLGCKSALTYTSQFTITGIKDGIKTVVMVSRIEDGTGVMEIVDESPTTEPNGVEISVPAKQGNTFASKAVNFFQFWDEGTVLLNGTAPKRFEGMQITENMWAVNGLNSDLIVMGGVPYPATSLFDNRGYNSFKVVAFVEIGEVNFTPAREALHDTPLTKATHARLKREFAAGLRKTVEDDIHSQPTAADAFQRNSAWKKMFGYAMPTGIQYNGQDIPDRFTGLFQIWSKYASRYSINASGAIDADTLQTSILITDKPADKDIVGSHKKKIKMWAEENGFVIDRYVIFGDATTGSPWVKPRAIVKWDDIMALKLPRAAKGTAVKAKPKYDVVTSAGLDTVEFDTIKTDVIYTSPRFKHNHRSLMLLAKEYNITVIIAGENRWGKIKEHFPKAIAFNTFINQKIEDVQKTLTQDDKNCLGMDYYEKAVLVNLDETKIDDPEVVKGIIMAKGQNTSATLDAYGKMKELVSGLGYGHRIENVGGVVQQFLDGYHLIGNRYGTPDTKHVYIYINAVYAAKQNGAI